MSGAECVGGEHRRQRRARTQDIHRQVDQRFRGPSGMAAYVLHLQRTIGNQAVGRLLRHHAFQPVGQGQEQIFAEQLERTRAADEAVELWPGMVRSDRAPVAGSTGPLQRQPDPGASAAGSSVTETPASDSLQSSVLDSPRLQAAYHNAPPLRKWDARNEVARLQAGLVQVGYPMPRSLKATGFLGFDGIWGPETTSTVARFQVEHGVRPVGGWEAGHKTLGALDALLGGGPPIPKGPEIPATDEALGKKVKDDMNALNAGPATETSGVWYAANYKEAFPKLWKDDYRSGYANPTYFERIDHLDWRLRPGLSASTAIKAWLQGLTIAECNSSLVAIEYDTLRAAVGDDRFDARFGSATKRIGEADRLRIRPMGKVAIPLDKFMAPTEAAKKRDAGTIGARPVKVGEWYYFCNHPKYLLKHPGGDWQGENAVYMGVNDAGKQCWSGFGTSNGSGSSIVTEQQMLDEMVRAYNAPRDDHDRETLRARFGSHPPKIYDENSGEFPPTITADQILSDPPYTIDGEERKGGFQVDVGKALDAARVQELRNE